RILKRFKERAIRSFVQTVAMGSKTALRWLKLLTRCSVFKGHLFFRSDRLSNAAGISLYHILARFASSFF
ncbi:hypothetical protein, partial [Paenibacillus sp. J31TS4]|uniref:hypothetical protein n=1 Tax=Paenibacillus sp. J31TS4 TaxID=2807195 RepID=UPI001BCAAD3B